MGDHLDMCVDRLITPESLQSMQGADAPGSSVEGSSSQTAEIPTCVIDVKGVEEHDVLEEEEPLIQMAECRICQEEDSIKSLETPCACSGSLKVFSNLFFHFNCVYWSTRVVVSLVIPLNFLDHSFLSGIFHQHLQNEVVGSISMWNRGDSVTFS